MSDATDNRFYREKQELSLRGELWYLQADSLLVEEKIQENEMSKLRPECGRSRDAAIPDDTALFLIRDSVAKRKGLIHGRLHDNRGGHCAIGCFFDDNPRATLHTALIDEVAAVNDSIPPTATAKERWTKVNEWLRFKIAAIAGAASKS
jgi:hypothetical protein